MLRKKKLKNLVDEEEPDVRGPPRKAVINPRDRQDNYVELFKKHFTFRQAEPVDAISNQEGLKRAYSQPNSLYTHGNVLHIAGTQMGRPFKTYRDRQPWGDAVQDVWDDLKIPFKMTAHSQRYKDALEVLKNNPGITHLNGHSLGGAVALQLQKDLPERKFTTSTYGAPTISLTPAPENSQRYRNPGDPVSILDRGTIKTPETKPSLNPLTAHGYGNFTHTSESNSNGWVIDKQFKPQPQYNRPMQPLEFIPQNDDEGWVYPPNYDGPKM